MKKLILTKDELGLKTCGLSIGIEGFKGNPADADDTLEQIYIEYWGGKIRVHVWNGEQDPKTLIVDPI